MKHRAPDDPSATAEEAASGDEGFLQRWSRLKGSEGQEAPVPPAPVEDQAPASTDDGPPEQVLTDVDMPPLESLGADSDFSPFMSSGVSEKLRQLALRKLFQLPYYNIRDGLDDYDEDFTVFEPLGDTVTADMKHRQERREAREREEREAELARQQATEEEPVAELDDEEVTDETGDRGESPRAQAPGDTTTNPADEDDRQRAERTRAATPPSSDDDGDTGA